jgi:hypothetical protein
VVRPYVVSIIHRGARCASYSDRPVSAVHLLGAYHAPRSFFWSRLEPATKRNAHNHVVLLLARMRGHDQIVEVLTPQDFVNKFIHLRLAQHDWDFVAHVGIDAHCGLAARGVDGSGEDCGLRGVGAVVLCTV